ncbi:peptide chain release factor N(5)-glutamine methyltransferase [Salinimonas sp. HHU 13199]|uniref:Release factor glutamine methyltransferase n=1 Tax=Salinimonas profundi TaxID=2729140 RepID=A0ABR8LIE2_9ALTE|nr:peptide chain release factor N(5)-glutamine methyltransferase [Salinimonas profundi]MBD3584968.1 peptide chain release factor N(5)-glutamine methyltransferase [Salinimonas profundi]
MQITEALKWAVSQLSDSDSAGIDARILLCTVIDKPQTYLFTWPEHELSANEKARFEALVRQRADGQPVAYLTGTRAFWSLTLHVSPTTLIPRPETELLVEQALARLPVGQARVCDLGTGTGAIALAIASERPDVAVTGVDRVADAVELARRNARYNHIENAVFAHSHWFDSLTGQTFSMIVSNPPYVEQNSHYLAEGDVRFEPASALTAGADGLDDIRYIIAQAPAHLKSDGWLLLEHGYNQAQSVQALLQQQGFHDITTVNDLAGQPRVTLGRRGER